MLFAEKKGGGGLHLYVDYCALNANVETDAWPLLYIDDLLSKLKSSIVFSSLDLHHGYHYILIDPFDQYKMVFACCSCY